MTSNWRISTVNGALLAAYFIPAWTLVAFQIMVSPIHGFYEQPNIAVAIYLSDHVHVAAFDLTRYAWLLAVGKLTTVAFFTIFLAFITRPKIRASGGCDEALWMALSIGAVISFASMVMASRVGEIGAMHLHAAELLMLLGTAIVGVVERPVASADEALLPQKAKLVDNR